MEMMVFQKLHLIADKNYNKPYGLLVYKVCKLIANILCFFLPIPSNSLDEKSNVVVSLTSYPARIGTIWFTLKTILRQSYKPYRIVLYLSKEQFPNEVDELPLSLKRLVPHGITVKFCDELYSHKKYYYAMQEYPNHAIITVDDDMLYPENLIESLLKVYESREKNVICTLAHCISIDKEKRKIKPYKEWRDDCNLDEKPKKDLIAIGCGGVLYPPSIFSKELFNKEKFLSLCPRTDDLWLKINELKENIWVKRVRTYNCTFFDVIGTKGGGLYHENVENNRNDEVMYYLVSEFPDIKDLLLEL